MSKSAIINNYNVENLRNKLSTIDRPWVNDISGENEPWYLKIALGKIKDANHRDSKGNYINKGRSNFFDSQLIYYASLHENKDAIRCAVEIVKKRLPPESWGSNSSWRPNIDLDAGWSNYIISLGYDLINYYMDENLKKNIIEVVTRQNNILADYYANAQLRP